jgi:glutathione S-transferase
MHGLILHSYRRCPFAIRVRMTLEEKGLEYEVIEESLREPSAALLALHPEGKVPLLVHDGLALFESAIITEYLEDSFPAIPLLPASASGRAEVRLLTYWCNHIFKPDLDLYKYRFDVLEEEGREALRHRIRAHLEKLVHNLEGWPFLLGGDFTLADIHLFPFYRQLTKARPDFASTFAKETAPLDAWLERIITRPSFGRVMEKKSVS